MRHHNARSVRYVTSHDFDEQLWPISAMLFIFACCVGAVVITAGVKEGRFLDPRLDPQPLYNAWLHLGVLVSVVFILVLGTLCLRHHVTTRRMQLAVMLALLVQFLEIMCLWVFPAAVTPEPQTNLWMSASNPAREVTIPDPEQMHDEVTQDSIHQPDQTRVTEQPQTSEAVRSATENRQFGRADSQGPAGANNQVVGHETQRVAMATSRESSRPGGTISRTERADRMNPSAALAPTASAVTQQNVGAINARTTPRERQDNNQPQLQRRPTTDPSAASAATVASIDRRQSDRPETNPSRTATPGKSATQQNLPSSPAAQANAEAIASSSASRVEARDVARSAATSSSSVERPSSASPAAASTSAVASLSSSASAQRVVGGQGPPTPQRSGQSIAKASVNPSASGEAAAATADAAAIRGSTTPGNLTAGATTRRDTTGQSGLPARGMTADAPTAATQSASFSATQFQRATTADSPASGTSGSAAQLARTTTTGGVPASGSAADSPAVATVAVGNTGASGPQASQSSATRSPTAGQSALASGAVGGGNVALPAEVGSMSGAERAELGQNVPTTSGRRGSSAALARSSTGDRSGVPDARAEGPDVAAVAVQGNSAGLQSAPTGEGTGRASTSAGSSIAQTGRGETSGQPSTAGGVGTTGATNASRAGSGGAGEPTVASIGSALRSGKATGGLDAQAVADAAGDGAGGAPAPAAQGGAGLVAQGGGGSAARSQTSAGTLGERSAAGGPAGAPSGGVTAGATNSQARAGGAGTSPQIGSTAQSLTKGTGSLAEGAAIAGAAADAGEGAGPATASASGGGPAARAAGRTADAGSTGGALSRGSAEDVGPTSGASSGLAGGSARAAASDGGPSVASSGLAGLGKSGTAAELPGGADLADDPGPPPGVAAGAETGSGRLGPAASQPSRGETNSLIVRSQGPEGPGGLSHDLSGQVGVPNRLALSSSDMVQSNPQRFPLNKTSGGLSLDGGKAELPKWAEQRSAAKRQANPELTDSDRAVEAGLDFLARHQSSDGRWSLHYFAAGKDYSLTRAEELVSAGRYPNANPMHSDTAATGLALLAFLGAGYTHQQGKYKQEVAGGLQHLMSNQKSSGDLFSGNARYVWLYSHGIASIALCEAYGMTRDPALKEPAQKAIDFIVAAQSPEGGWRYAPGVGSDTSVSGWQVMALKSGQLAGLKVPADCLKRVERWLDYAHPRDDKSRYIYRPQSNLEHQNTASPTMTAEGLLMRLYLGWKPDNADLLRGADYLLENLPAYRGDQRNSYYWYYATYLLVHVKGERWTTWNDRLKKLLIETQENQGPLRGSWNPWGGVPDRWGMQAGRIYNTAIHVLMLETDYRKLPLYTEDVVASEK
jgi:hypothetical protein